MNKLLTSLLLSCALAHAPASAAGDPSGDISVMSGFASVVLVYGSLMGAGASGEVVVESVEKVGDATVVVVKGMSDGARATLRLSGTAAGNVSVGVGKVVKVTATASGHLLSVAGEVLAFLPNEIGKSLLHHSRTGG